MANWRELLDQIQSIESPFDQIRRKYLKKLHEKTNRNIIAYYSAFLEKSEIAARGFSGFQVDDSDLNGFMATIHKLDRSKGLDLILHTPGGSIAATEAIVRYLHLMFDGNIRAIIPHLAMSAGTMIALSCRSILMGKQSSLGPIDPQVFGYPAHGVLEEFEVALQEIKDDKDRIAIWQPIIANYNPTLVGECEKAIKWTNQLVKDWLRNGMFKNDNNGEQKAKHIVSILSDHSETKTHNRHIGIEDALKLDIKVEKLEVDNDLQDLVLTVHHSYIHTLAQTAACKIIENQDGVASIKNLKRA